MFHHDERDYKTAKSDAAKRGRDKLQAVIDRGRASAAGVVQQIQTRVIQDAVVRAPAVRLVYDDDGDRFLAVGDRQQPVHDHGYRQVLENAGVPHNYLEHLTKEAGGDLWGKKLAAQNVNEILSHRDKQRNLVRSEGADGLVKGFLSDRVHRMLAAIEDAGEDDIRGAGGIDKLLARHLDKTELATVKTMFEGPDVQNLPPGDTVWRLSNAVSWFAQGKTVTADRKLALQELAGTMVAGETKKVKEV
jgi:hypothetical protein